MEYLTRRSVMLRLLAATAGAAIPGIAIPEIVGRRMTAQQVFEAIKSASGQYWNPNPTDDIIQFGDPDTPVTGIATCFFAPIVTLAAARDAGLNYIIPHECTFYERYDDIAESVIPDDDATLMAKLNFLRDNHMVVQRMHQHAHTMEGDFIGRGLLQKLGWTGYRIEDPSRAAICRIPQASAMDVGRHIKKACERRTMRMFGNPEKQVSLVSISGGMPGENFQIQQISHEGVDAVILGEVREPEVIGYAQDLSASRDIVVYLNGHTSEDFGMGLLADWIGNLFPDIPVKWLPTVDPYTNPV